MTVNAAAALIGLSSSHLIIIIIIIMVLLVIELSLMLDSVHCIELVRQLLQMWLVRLRLLASCECYYAIIDPALQPMKAIFVSPLSLIHI